MKTIKNLAWLPCAALAAGLPGLAAAESAERPKKHATPAAVVVQLETPSGQERPTEVETTHAETDPDIIAQDTLADEQDTVAMERDAMVATETHAGRDVRQTDRAQRDTRADARPGEQTAEEARLEARVDTTIALNRSLQRSDIDVRVDGTTAVLTGTVDDDLHRELAEELAMNVDGIERVENELRVDEEFAGVERDPEERTFAQTVEDATTTTAVRSRLLWSRHADGINTEVETRDGHVTLSGTAESEEARQMAEQLARNAWGVTSVTNEITVDPDRDAWRAGTDETVTQERTAAAQRDRAGMTQQRTAVADADREQRAATQDQVAGTGLRTTDRDDDRFAQDRAVTTDRDARTAGLDRDADDDRGFTDTVSDAWITTKVRSSFLTSRWIASRDIDIETNDGVVVLSGELDSAAERDLAIEVAENIRGVERVDARNLTVIS